MSKNFAIVVQQKGEAKVVECPIPKLQDDYILVRVKAIALNPTDWKHVDNLCTNGTRIGVDFAGVVEEIGSKVTKDFKKGDRICGFSHGGNEVHKEDGAFGNYITARGDVQMKIPENLSFEAAATLGVGIVTTGQALYQALKLPLPTQPSSTPIPLLIYGGSTATGALAIQYAKLSGCEVITTCSPHNLEYVTRLGASKVFDYNSPTCAEDIKSYNPNIAHVLDCIATGSTPTISVKAMASSGGVYTALLPSSLPTEMIKAINPNVESTSTLAYTVVGKGFTMGGREFPAIPENYEFGKMWLADDMAMRFLREGKVVPHQYTVDKFGKGLEGALAGMQAMREGKVSGEKLVYKVE